ncbi:MAG: hypothetical protein N2645_14005 [Clostridia bacterium]|nr:hypothetical protein [Clostridia bacterium]
MMSIFWSVILWGAVLIWIPFDRIKRLWKVMIISPIWLFIVDFTFVSLGYYRFPKATAVIGGIPLFYLVGGSAAGIILMNRFPKKNHYRAVYIIGFSILFMIAEQFFIFFHEFEHIKWNGIFGLTQNIAGLSILAILSLGIVGEKGIYEEQDTARS